jgi:superfamily II DNA or RNA helicase
MSEEELKSKENNVDDVNNDKTIEDKMKKDFSYPDPSDPEFQYKIYKKREFYYHKSKARPNVENYEELKEYREMVCARSFSLFEHQSLLSNLINPNTPYKGILTFHGTGTGKCSHPDTLVSINNMLSPICDIWNIYKTEIVNDNEGGEWSVPENTLIVNSFDDKLGKIVKGNIVHLYREYIDSHIREILLDNGSKIKITDAHKLLKNDGWSNDIKEGDYVCVSKTEETKEVCYIKVKSVTKQSYKGYVYDIEVKNYHNYIAEGVLMHNTCVGISIAEKFKPLVQKYNTKIVILVGGPLIKENWKQHLLKCTGETYLKYQDKSVYIDDVEKAKTEKNAMIQALQYYKFMSYKSFYKHVIGEKITDRQSGKKGKATYRKTDEGEFERDISVDRIYNLNNTLIIVDEAHNLTGNTYGDALKYIIKNSINLKIVLMSATPMKNLGSDIVELINFLRPLDSQIEKDKIFTSNKGHLLDFKEGGLTYLKNMMRGYVSHVRGADPLTFAKRVDKGYKPNGLLFTKVLRCTMLSFQRKTYDLAETEHEEDTLDRKSEAVANFVFPGLSADRKELVGYYAGEGLNLVKNQLKVNGELINKKISKELFGNDTERDLIYITQDGRSISGKILKLPYLKYFSIKFYKSLKKLNRLVWGKKGASTAFVYSNLVKVGISMFHEILLQNGYLEYQDDYTNYQLSPSTVCYFCGRGHAAHKSESVIDDTEYDNDSEDHIKSKPAHDILNMSETSSDYVKPKKSSTDKIPPHTFRPATFITITGKSNEEALESLPEDKMNIIKNIFNHTENKDGRNLKFVLGSRVMNEGISLANVSEVHILDAYFNFGRIDQVVGRAIRSCFHYKLMSETNVYPIVNIYKYVVAIENGLSTEEELYKKAELKYLLVKKIERAMKEVAVDCPLNINANMFKEEIDMHKKCVPFGHENLKDGEEPCPAICDYTKCNYSCDDAKLNAEYYDPTRSIYTKISKNSLDYSTFTHGLARNEIDYAKDKIKELYITGYMYTLEDVLVYVKSTYDEEKRELFDQFFIFKALDELIPITENDFNNFRDTVIDKHNRPGYLIYINKYYIFQPFDQNENIPMYYRTNVTRHVSQQLSLYNYLKNNVSFQQMKEIKGKRKSDDESLVKEEQTFYNFEDTAEYYENRDEFKYVGFIDKELSRRKNKTADEIKDVFKLRESRAKILAKKRESGLASYSGAVCSSSKTKQYLAKVAKEIGIELPKGSIRQDVCTKIEQQLLYLEKYTTGKDKKTYIILPSNHPVYPFPYNLQDRVEIIVSKIKAEISSKVDINVTNKKKSPKAPQIELVYTIHIKDSSAIKDHIDFLKKLKAEKSGSEWLITVD